MATYANIITQVQGYTCYTLFNIICIITRDIIINNSHNSVHSIMCKAICKHSGTFNIMNI